MLLQTDMTGIVTNSWTDNSCSWHELTSLSEFLGDLAKFSEDFFFAQIVSFGQPIEDRLSIIQTVNFILSVQRRVPLAVALGRQCFHGAAPTQRGDPHSVASTRRLIPRRSQHLS